MDYEDDHLEPALISEEEIQAAVGAPNLEAEFVKSQLSFLAAKLMEATHEFNEVSAEWEVCKTRAWVLALVPNPNRFELELVKEAHRNAQEAETEVSEIQERIRSIKNAMIDQCKTFRA